jgi:hypothetical protein
MRKLIAAAVAATALTGLAASVEAQDKKDVEAGMLRCHEASGWGLVFGSTRELKCTFSGAEKDAKPVGFNGTIKRYGVDIGYKGSAIILWAVATTSDKFTPGQIAGSYGGLTAEASWAAGLGANVLVGGTAKGIALQPVSVTGIAGANLAAGVVEVELTQAN